MLAPDRRKAYILGGNAIFTVVSPSGARFTYKVKEAREGHPHWVSVLNGPENTSDYAFLGTIFNGDRYFHSRKSRIPPEAPSAKAFTWFWEHLEDPRLEVWHSGRCSRCGRLLTDPESVEIGLGPVCRGL